MGTNTLPKRDEVVPQTPNPLNTFSLQPRTYPNHKVHEAHEGSELRDNSNISTIKTPRLGDDAPDTPAGVDTVWAIRAAGLPGLKSGFANSHSAHAREWFSIAPAGSHRLAYFPVSSFTMARIFK